MRMAGARTSASVMVPYVSTSALQPESAPGTVTERAPLPGTSSGSSAASASTSIFEPDLPLASRPTRRPASASHRMANMSPPMPVMCGSVTLSTAAAATAASMALPPSCRISRAVAVARGWLVAATPLGAYTVERPERVAGLVTGAVVMVRTSWASVRSGVTEVMAGTARAANATVASVRMALPASFS